MTSTGQQSRHQGVQNYHEAWLAAHGSAQDVADQVEQLARLNSGQLNEKSTQTHDRVLVTIAQNVVLRLNLRRCLISLIDASKQYVIAEATRSCSSAFPCGKDGDKTWLGTAVFSQPEAMGDDCLASQCEAFEDDGSIYQARGIIIDDCQLDESSSLLKSHLMQAKGFNFRFYAAVPLIAPSGLTIGTLAVTDEEARNGLHADELRWMQDMAECAVTHLEWAVDRVERFKSERVALGMAKFIDGASALLDGSRGELDAHQDDHGDDDDDDDAQIEEHHDDKANSETSDPGTKQSQDEDGSGHQHEAEPASKDGATANDSTEEAQAMVETTILVDTTLDKNADAEGSSTDADADHRLIAMHTMAARMLRDCTLADNCLIYGVSKAMQDEEDTSSIASREDGNSSIIDSPACRVLACAPDMQTASTRQHDAIAVNTLRDYASRFPHGHVFDLIPEDQEVITSPLPTPSAQIHPTETLDISRSSSRSTSYAKKGSKQSSTHYEKLFSLFPQARTVVFLPLVDQGEDKLAGGIFLSATKSGRMAAGLSHLRAFTHCIEREIMRINTQRNQAAKTTFIASISHELRSPLHGILGAAEFLADSCKNTAYEHGLVASISLCGKQLLDTLNHVLDYSKINNSGVLHNRIQQDDDGTVLEEAIDLGALVEEASEAITVGHTFKTVAQAKLRSSAVDTSVSNDLTAANKESTNVVVLLDVRPRQSWMVRTSPGSLQRVIMNLLGNALKFTVSGFVALSLRATAEPDEDGKLDVLIRVVDSGPGIGKAYQNDRLFTAFTQEDSFTPGTGLGLNVVKQIISSLGGSIRLRSKVGLGTEVDVRFKLAVDSSSTDETHNPILTENFLHGHSLAKVVEHTKGKLLVIIDPTDKDGSRPPTHSASRFQQNLRETCEQWFDMRVSRAASIFEAPDNTAIYLYGEPPALEMLKLHSEDNREQSVPVIIACQNDRDAIAMVRDQQAFLREFGKIVEVIQQPCGPRKLGAMLMHCFLRATDAKTLDNIEKSEPSKEILDELYDVPKIPSGMLSRSVSAAVAMPVPVEAMDVRPSELDKLGVEDSSLDILASEPMSPSNEGVNNTPNQPGVLHGLIVDDNKINRQLLVTFMNKAKHTFVEAENGQEAVDAFLKAGTSDEKPRFDIIFMDISMPVMDGYEATRTIRAEEQKSGLARTKIVALTGLGDAKAREDAEAAGVDVFMTKPAKFAELKKLLHS